MIEVKNLTKKYGSFTAVDNISFTVEKGKIYGFLGPNGAGKSTTMNIITGCLAATSGEVSVNGHDIYEEPVEAKRSIGYLPEIPPLYTDMTPEEYLYFVGEAKGLNDATLDVAVERVMERTGLLRVRDRLIRNLSKGYKQRVGIAQAILGDPEIIILDEPTVGLDPLQIIEIRDMIKELGRDHTVILSSHILTEISAVCDTVIVISHGKIVAHDSIENLTTAADGRRIIKADVRGDIKAVTQLLTQLRGAVSTSAVHGLGGCVHITVETPAGCDMRDEVFRLFAGADIPIVEMTTNDISLEDVFLRLTEDKTVLDISENTEDTEKPEESEESVSSDMSEETEEVEEADEAEDTDSPYYTKKSKKKDKKNSGDEEYTPLFGGKE